MHASRACTTRTLGRVRVFHCAGKFLRACALVSLIWHAATKNMPTNLDNIEWVATTGQRVKVKPWVTPPPDHDTRSQWKGIGIVRGIELDNLLTGLNLKSKNIQVYRILVDFGNDELASVLPPLLEKVHSDRHAHDRQAWCQAHVSLLHGLW